MATYQTIAELLQSTDNLQVIRNNSKNDDGTDTLAGVSWFRFKGNVASNIYVNGNGWINFGVNSEGGLKVNRRDQASWYVWREEGNIHTSSKKFLRIRWRGYSYYSTTAEANLLDFDVVLCNTGDIILKIHTWPTANADGVNRLEAATNVPFTPSQTDKEFSFIHQDDAGNNFTLVPGIIEVLEPFYWLIQDGTGDTYTIDVVDGRQVTRKLAISTLTAQVFKYNGFELDVDPALLADIDSPRLLCWNASKARTIHATVRAIPAVQQPQLIVFQNTVAPNIPSVVTITGDDSTLWNVSFDTGTTWWTHTGSAWEQVTADGAGCAKAAVESIPASDWAQKANGNIQFRCWMPAGGWVSLIRIDF